MRITLFKIINTAKFKSILPFLIIILQLYYIIITLIF